MAVEDDPQYKKWRAAADNLEVAIKVCLALKHLPKSNPQRKVALAAKKRAEAALKAISADV